VDAGSHRIVLKAQKHMLLELLDKDHLSHAEVASELPVNEQAHFAMRDEMPVIVGVVMLSHECARLLRNEHLGADVINEMMRDLIHIEALRVLD
jgi:hypothetical protein